MYFAAMRMNLQITRVQFAAGFAERLSQQFHFFITPGKKFFSISILHSYRHSRWIEYSGIFIERV
jgi:hypothetical protein